MQKIIVCPVGDQPDAIFPALREFNVKHVHMLTHKSYLKEADQLKKNLDTFGIPYSERELSDDIWEDTFYQISQFAKEFPDTKELITHAGIGDRYMQCAATTASFVNGIQAVNGNKKIIMGLPIMRFSYYKLLNERKRAILLALQDGKVPMNQLSKDLKISLSLLSYHIHGNLKSEGLEEMGLVQVSEEGNQQALSLTSMGRMILRGSIPHEEEPKAA